MRRLIQFLLQPRTERLFDPDSPGMFNAVTRTWIGRLFKPKHFATLSESIKSNSSELGVLKRKMDFWNLFLVVAPWPLFAAIWFPTTLALHLWITGVVLILNVMVAIRYSVVRRSYIRVWSEQEDRRRREAFSGR